MVLILMVVLFALPLSVSAEQLDISGQTELTVLKGKSYQLVFTEAASLLQKLNTAAQTESTATGAQTETEQKDNVITWSSSKKSVVSVSATGKIRAKKTGSAMITAQLGELKYYVKVTVNTPVTKVKLNKTSKTIKCGKTYTLKATVKPSKNVNKKSDVVQQQYESGKGQFQGKGYCDRNRYLQDHCDSSGRQRQKGDLQDQGKGRYDDDEQRDDDAFAWFF
jgi:hypothetical protein